MLIVGIEPSPKGKGIHVFTKYVMPRVGLPRLFTIAEKMGHRCVIFCEDIAPIDWSVVERADIVCISSITSTINRAYEIIRQIRKGKNHKVPVLMGGAHPTYMPDEALMNGADYVFGHEADVTFPWWLNWYCGSNRDPRDLMGAVGISFLVAGRPYHTPRPPFVDLDTLPTPNLRLIRGYDHPGTIPIISSAGCPLKCRFCMVQKMFGNCYRFRSVANVIKDLEYYDGVYGRAISVFYGDDNHAASERRLVELCHGVNDHGLERQFCSQVRLDLAKNPELLRLMSEVGYNREYIGYESLRQDALDAQEKHLDAGKMAEYTAVFHKHGHAIHSMWVYGFDGDTTELVKETTRFCIKNRIETTQFVVLVPLPGSEMYEELRDAGRIFNHDWSDYDGHHVTFRPIGMTARQLQYWVMLKAMPNLYSLGHTAMIFIADVRRTSIRTLSRVFRHRKWHPIFEFRRNRGTLLARLWAWWATHKVKKPIWQYYRRMPLD